MVEGHPRSRSGYRLDAGSYPAPCLPMVYYHGAMAAVKENQKKSGDTMKLLDKWRRCRSDTWFITRLMQTNVLPKPSIHEGLWKIA